MDLDEQLSELLAGLGVVLEEPGAEEEHMDLCGDPELEPEEAMEESGALDQDTTPSELSLFQTSREHYGVFYRLDLIEDAPQLRIFMPDERGPVKMRCYLVRAVAGSPVCGWFVTSRAAGGSEAYEDARDTTQQHLLFAAGELMKRLFWAGDPEVECFPGEISVRRLV